MNKIFLESVGSTNSYIKENIKQVEPQTLVIARSQTAGRGQRGNSWESEPGKNLTFSFWFRPAGISPAEQFVISEASALAVVDTLAAYGIDAKVKWPNDIYVADSKICGILIENSIFGPELTASIIGAGLNVNQTKFLSDAPNPVSMRQITGKEIDIEDVAERISETFDRRLAQLSAPQGKKAIHSEYLSTLWHGDSSLYPYRDASSGETFHARIAGVELSGHLRLQTQSGVERRFAFKEVIFL